VPTYGRPIDPIAPLRAALRGHYEIEREIGQGAFATVYLARDLKHERKVAVKVLNADPTSETGELRFIREIRLLARLQHPNILPLHDSGHVEELLYYVMPYIAGETLRGRIDRERQLPIGVACSVARDIADALAYAHGQGIVHRDIKPENILLSAGHPILADFGIARLIDLAGVRQLTRTGIGSPGTPAYMSPEQLMGDKELDGRSDSYSLGCVLFEMLAGKPPFSGKDGFVRRFTEPPPDVLAIRAKTPVAVSAAIRKSLARDPADRFQTATEFVEALCAQEVVGADVSRAIPTPPPRNAAPAPPPTKAHAPTPDAMMHGMRTAVADSIRNHRSSVIGASALLAVMAAAAFSGPMIDRVSAAFGGAPIDSARVLVLPLAARDSALGRAISERFYDAFRGWSDLAIVPDTKVSEIISASGGTPKTEADALRAARKIGAGKLVWGQVTGAGASPRVTVHLFDVSLGTSRNELVIQDPGSGASVYEALMFRLLKPRSRPTAADGGDGLTSSYTAWSAYGAAHSALSNGDYALAERLFSTSLTADPQFPLANLWLAQVREWRSPAPKSGWLDHASRAATSSRLGARDRLLADALVAMGNAMFPVACEKYQQLTLRDSADFAGWYGMGECRYLDSAVVASSASPSGWAFRSSSVAAAAAYERAIRLAPGAHSIFSFSRLEALLPTSSTRVRLGASENRVRRSFMASAALMGPNETLSFVPYPVSSFSQRPASASATLSAAIAKNSAQLLEYTLQWVATARNDPAAFEALADVLDVRGQISDNPDPTGSALSALRRAGALSTDSHQLVRLATKEVWMLFKRGEFAEAKKRADLALKSASDEKADALVLVSLAALTGRVNLMAHLSDVSNAGLPESVEDMDAPLKTAVAEFFARAALGACDAAITSRTALDQAIDRYAAPAAAPTVSRSILARPLSMLVPCTGGGSILEIANPSERLPRLQRAFAAGDKFAFRSLSDSIASRIRNRRPGDLSPDFVYQKAWLTAASGDTAAAEAQLDRSLAALPGLNGSALREAGSAAAILRAMQLRAELAAKTGDALTARKWASAVLTLWADADAELQPSLVSMRSLVSSGT
jgi:eukaryotic-like serine/threonine-protein kinase